MSKLGNFYVIMNPDERDFETNEPCFWSNKEGWVALETDELLVVTEKQSKNMDLPTIGSPKARWMRLAVAVSVVSDFRCDSALAEMRLHNILNPLVDA
jgi:hypothetical protein